MTEADRFALALSGKTAEQIQAAILGTLKERLKAVKVYKRNGTPTAEAMDVQANYVAGASAALHAVFESSDSRELTSLVPPKWVWYTLRGQLIVDPYK